MSAGELEMTRKTSEVAVCCSSDSASSRVRCCSASNNRAFSIAITAWSANVVTSSICLSVKGLTAFRVNTITPIGVPSRISGRLIRYDIHQGLSAQLKRTVDRPEHPQRE